MPLSTNKRFSNCYNYIEKKSGDLNPIFHSFFRTCETITRSRRHIDFAQSKMASVRISRTFGGFRMPGADMANARCADPFRILNFHWINYAREAYWRRIGTYLARCTFDVSHCCYFVIVVAYCWSKFSAVMCVWGSTPFWVNNLPSHGNVFES